MLGYISTGKEIAKRHSAGDFALAKSDGEAKKRGMCVRRACGECSTGDEV